ncbi:protein phosphatase regulator [Madurella fahalii]|uniref:Protein phosphatase regulator n=1 Tax=Madurella fahalii TaxID=1157608 RepID=A0ABQ0GRP6_9PEZI
MTRPEIIRADTIDLQAHDKPSAQRHHRPAADGSLAPHQAETLREAAAEAAEENLRSPRVPWNADPDDPHQHVLTTQSAIGGPQTGGANNMAVGAQQDALAIAQNGGLSGHEADDGDLDGDAEVDMDDDLMDKISSSPSIEDGGSTPALPSLSLSRSAPSSQSTTSRERWASSSISDPRSSSPYLESPDHLPLRTGGRKKPVSATRQSCSFSISSRHHHASGEFEAEDRVEEQTSTGNYDVSDNTECGGSGLETGKGCFARGLEDTNEFDVTMRERSTRTLLTPLEPGEEDGIDAIQGILDDDELTVPYESAEDDDGDFSQSLDSRFIDSGWGGECLQETEDIDFEFVYALHTFVATVEGQANATKGDTMVLLDDSNSYWWLVRVVKDSSIGYLPAEHIETPTERLARLNKHRNVDLSASMLGDQAEKTRNPIKSAMKRRKTKTVQFAAPTYVDYSDIDYSTEEEDVEAEYLAQQQKQQAQQSTGDMEIEDESARVEPLKPRSQAKVEVKKQEAGGDSDALATNKAVSRSSEDSADAKSSDGPKKRSDGTVRDSFFKDDTVETKKITLTPNLLRDDDGPRASSDSKEVKQRPSLDKLDKDNILGKDDKKKKKEKEKDKKSGGIRSFFSRKDKKSKGDEDDDPLGKRSMESDALEKEAEDEDLQPSPEKAAVPQRHPSKLQKQQPRTEPSPTRKPNSTRENAVDVRAFLSEGKVNNVANVPPASMRIVDASPKASPESSPRIHDPSPAVSKSTPSKTAKAEPRPQQAVQTTSRVGLDDFDSDEDITPQPTQQGLVGEEPKRQQAQPVQPVATESEQDPSVAAQTAARSGPTVASPPQQSAERLSESPVQVSPVSGSNPPPLMVDTSSQEEDRLSQRSTPSPEFIEHEDADTSGNKDSMTSATTARSSWDDASLRAFFDSGSDIRDLLVVVYDKNNVDSDPSDHPVANSLFREQNAKLAEITTRLDDMLGDWLARKQRLRGAV